MLLESTVGFIRQILDGDSQITETEKEHFGTVVRGVLALLHGLGLADGSEAKSRAADQAGD